MMRTCVRILLAVVIALSGAVLSPEAAKAAGEPVGAFTRVEGNVDVFRMREGAAMPVRPGDPVFMADAIRTKRDGKAPQVGTAPNGEPDLLSDIAEYVGRILDESKDRPLYHVIEERNSNVVVADSERRNVVKESRLG